jgi:hypothetical protein
MQWWRISPIADSHIVHDITFSPTMTALKNKFKLKRPELGPLVSSLRWMHFVPS